jgi:hypothetical protein
MRTSVKGYRERMVFPLRVFIAGSLPVENQVALGDTFAARAVLLRLMAEGLDRHEAIHAIGSVLSVELFAALRGEEPGIAQVDFQVPRQTSPSKDPRKPVT